MLLLSGLFLVVSIFFIYEWLVSTGRLDMPLIFLEKFSSNNLLLLTREVLLRWTLLLGVLGVIMSLFLFICLKDSEKEERDKKFISSFVVLLVFYIAFAFFLII